ncbi:MAG: 4-alpha-glucanotransferase, partial [Thermomicrobium sp.]
HALPFPVDTVEGQLTTVPGANGTRLVDYQTSWQQRLAALKAASQQLAQQTTLRQEIETWLDTHPILAEYARFRAAVDHFGRPSRWPSSLRAELLRSGVRPGEPAWPYAVAQWLAAQQIATVGHAALYLDLPLGVHPEGFDVWRWPHLFVTDVSAGAPPDPFFAEGQVWGFPPLHPERVREDGYRYLRAVFAHHLSAARLLRIDHVMGFHRLYWVPAQASGREGVYVRYPAAEYYAVLAIESYRSGCAVAGEDLGTVPRAVRQAMARERLLRLWVLPFERRNGTFTTPPRRCVASLDTHDLPPFAALWDEWGHDIQRAVVAWLAGAGFLAQQTAPGLSDVIGALLRFLGSSDATVVLVNLEDLWGERQPQNRPGTGLEQPNWRRLARYGIADLATTSGVLELLETLHRSRKEHRQRTARAATHPLHDQLGKGL